MIFYDLFGIVYSGNRLVVVAWTVVNFALIDVTLYDELL